MFFYSEASKGGKFTGDIWEMNGTHMYLKHYDNMLFLKFVADNKLSSFQEKSQAEKEILICERKLTFWRRHPNYDQDEATKGCAVLKSKWQGK